LPETKLGPAGGDAGPVRAEGCAPHPFLEPFEFEHGTTRPGVPDGRVARLIVATTSCRDDPRAVRAERDTRYGSPGPFQLEKDRTVSRIPPPGRAIATRGDEARAIRAERQARHAVPLPREFEPACPRPRVPHLGRTINTSGDDARAIRAERRGHHP